MEVNTLSSSFCAPHAHDTYPRARFGAVKQQQQQQQQQHVKIVVSKIVVETQNKEELRGRESRRYRDESGTILSLGRIHRSSVAIEIRETTLVEDEEQRGQTKEGRRFVKESLKRIRFGRHRRRWYRRRRGFRSHGNRGERKRRTGVDCELPDRDVRVGVNGVVLQRVRDVRADERERV